MHFMMSVSIGPRTKNKIFCIMNFQDLIFWNSLVRMESHMLCEMICCLAVGLIVSRTFGLCVMWKRASSLPHLRLQKKAICWAHTLGQYTTTPGHVHQLGWSWHNKARNLNKRPNFRLIRPPWRCTPAILPWSLLALMLTVFPWRRGP